MIIRQTNLPNLLSLSIFTGECSVSPLSGLALSTNFTLRCDKWTDNESPLIYEVSYGGNKSQTIFAYSSSPSGVDVSITSWLVAGDESKNYTLTVAFNVKDSLGSKAAVQYVGVQVWCRIILCINCVVILIFCCIG